MSGRLLRHCLGTARQSHFIAAAGTVADILRANARSARDSSVYWRHPAEPVGAHQPAPLGPFLYSGTTGISLFLAAAARVLASDDCRDISLRAIAPVRRQVREVVSDPFRARSVTHLIGGLSGLGSLVYAFTRMGDLLDDFSLIEDAHAVTALITRERISSDEGLDVMLGSAGAILALLALEERQPGRNRNGATPLELASTCALHLVGRRRSYQDLATVWLTSSGQPPPNGFCHGITGISTALLRLSERSDQWGLREIARQSLEYERSLYVPSEKNWKLDDSGEASFANSWCKGAPGMVLSRLIVFQATGDPAAEEELAAALETTGSFPLSETDDLCCGNSGRIDVLLHAYRELGAPAYLGAARNLAEAVLERARRNGYYSLKLGGEPLLDLRLFNGLAGVGYSLLRLAVPDLVPCVTALD